MTLPRPTRLSSILSRCPPSPNSSQTTPPSISQLEDITSLGKRSQIERSLSFSENYSQVSPSAKRLMSTASHLHSVPTSVTEQLPPVPSISEEVTQESSVPIVNENIPSTPSSQIMPVASAPPGANQRAILPTNRLSLTRASAQVQTPLSSNRDAALASKKTFRFQAKSLYATYPQCAAKKEDVLQKIVEKWSPNVLFAVVSEEKHQDGSPHLHVLVKFQNQISSSCATFADFLTGSHGNYQSARNISHVWKYVTKDGCYVVHGDVPIDITTAEASGKVTMDEIADFMVSGGSLQDVFKRWPGKMLMYRNRIEQFQQLCESASDQERMPFTGILIPEDADTTYYSVANWLNSNLPKAGDILKRDFKTAQLYLSGPPNSGKTSMIRDLMKYFRVYFAPMTEDFYDEYDDNLYDLVVFDEFRSSKPITWLNQFLDGSIMTIRKKGRQYLKKKNLPCIILSNYALDECYESAVEKNPVALDSLKARLLQVQVTMEVVPPDFSMVPKFLKLQFNEDVETPVETE